MGGHRAAKLVRGLWSFDSAMGMTSFWALLHGDQVVGSWVLGCAEVDRIWSKWVLRVLWLCESRGPLWVLSCTFVYFLILCLCSEIAVDKRYGKADKELGVKADEASEQTFSMRKRMSAFPRMDTEMTETPSLALPNPFPQNEGPSSLAGTFRRPVGVFEA
jgi:hypothetical protein